MKHNSRKIFTLAPQFKNSLETSESKKSIPILLSPSDQGVRRNLGRNGARFGARAIIEQFKKLNSHHDLQFYEKTVTEQNDERHDFELAQKNQARRMSEILAKRPRAIHLGGGHDHVLPFLIGIDLKKDIKNMIIINLDAHLDKLYPQPRSRVTLKL